MDLVIKLNKSRENYTPKKIKNQIGQRKIIFSGLISVDMKIIPQEIKLCVRC